MVHFKVTIPPHAKSGQTIRIRCPDGTEGDVKLPKGLKGGDSFMFEIPKKSSNRISFLDREIASLHDFIVALGLGVLIGLSIVIGFLLGILYITDPEDGSTGN
jgi:hypothetical protein|mmetsp:Transcript_10084/g.18316  ORF Transcript_10084/g.18316 Transcript_10084/m.18316 type:complete len:103 (-) Transcript_10084:342-650(-)|eukprot:CAMPEP_0202490614 /NCGR_PEP_ID=MMETSP1361-20130828/7965_1 /ASSEMBLY_ACC=CAM_ASM_000849 /TAXON_ID=210615 /ORGANISM="Staurosira complex sp., Strain CCMP2646" /LENGTH=102 /DNA_ID=CAMNT_0049120531 /DNA_START=168 /DNA_END=476 /DNA_ORIENTATION=-